MTNWLDVEVPLSAEGFCKPVDVVPLSSIRLKGAVNEQSKSDSVSVCVIRVDGFHNSMVRIDDIYVGLCLNIGTAPLGTIARGKNGLASYLRIFTKSQHWLVWTWCGWCGAPSASDQWSKLLVLVFFGARESGGMQFRISNPSF